MRIFNDYLDLNEGQILHIRLGTLRLHIARLLQEWQITQTFEQPDLNRAECVADYRVPSATPPFRYAVGQSGARLDILPRMAPLPVVVRPFSPILVAPGTHITMFCSTSLWLDVSLPGEGQPAHHEVPVREETETWFGPTPMEGELCYAVKTLARLYLDAVSHSHGRVLTCMHIYNQASKAISVDRICLPVPYLSLYEDDQGFLCTNDVSVELNEERKEAELTLRSRPWHHLGTVRKVAEPRIQSQTSRLKRVLGRWLQ